MYLISKNFLRDHIQCEMAQEIEHDVFIAVLSKLRVSEPIINNYGVLNRYFTVYRPAANIPSLKSQTVFFLNLPHQISK